MLGKPEPLGVGGNPGLADGAAGSAVLKHAGACGWLSGGGGCCGCSDLWLLGFFCLLFVCAHFVLF